MTAARVQRKRTKGWRMPENTVYVGRGSKWGNPYKIEQRSGSHPFVVMSSFRDHILGAFKTKHEAAAYAVDVYEMQTDVMGIYYRPEVPNDLAGKNLACWCPLDQPCHADVLLELANR